MKPVISVTVGDPCGIGPEVFIHAVHRFLNRPSAAPVYAFVDSSYFLKKELRLVKDHLSTNKLIFKSAAPWIGPLQRGHPSKKSGAFALKNLELAVQFCKSNNRSALVTGPLDKFYVSKSSPRFSGHTGFLKTATASKNSIMILRNRSLTVALVTTHIPLKDVSKKLRTQDIVATAETLHNHLSLFKKNPRIAICALNPHASDNGLFGSEERNIIAPAVSRLKKIGLIVSGPLPADSLFFYANEYDGIVCLYHDQGLIPLKMSGFYDAINITAGLPFPRTSVDHGTAFSIAGKGSASSESFYQALLYAEKWLKKIS